MDNSLDQIDALLLERSYLSVTILEIVTAYVKEKLIGYDVSCEYSPDGCDTVCVNVYNVPEDEVKGLRSRIHDFDNEVDKHGIMILPMIKDVKTTKKYYPEYYKE